MRRKVLLLSPGGDESEMRDLLASLRWEILADVAQRGRRPDPRLFFGSGKLAETRELLAQWSVRISREKAAGLDGGPPELSLRDPETVIGAAFEADAAARKGRGRGERAKREWGTRKRVKKPSRRQRALIERPTVVVDAELKPSQIAGIEKALGGAEVFDRTRVILEIFQERARNEEARLQVEAARLRYEIPLVREYIRLAKVGEHPGFMAGGEYGVNQYFDTIQKRLTKVNRELEHIAKERASRRKHRRRSGFVLVSLAGYTNAGKSSLMRALSGEDVLVENRMFSTLDTKTARMLPLFPPAPAAGRDARIATNAAAKAETGEGSTGHALTPPRAEGRGTVVPRDDAQIQSGAREVQRLAGGSRGKQKIPDGPPEEQGIRGGSREEQKIPGGPRERQRILVTDTVGFIRDLPPWLIKAFRSTLEEIALSDLIVLVVDASEPPGEALEKFIASYQVLLGFERIPTLVVALNKCDIVPSRDRREEVAARLAEPGLVPEERFVFISAETGEGLPDLVRLIGQNLTT